MKPWFRKLRKHTPLRWSLSSPPQHILSESHYLLAQNLSKRCDFHSHYNLNRIVLTVVAVESQMLYTREFSMLYLLPPKDRFIMQILLLGLQCLYLVFIHIYSLDCMYQNDPAYNADSWIPTQTNTRFIRCDWGQGHMPEIHPGYI